MTRLVRTCLVAALVALSSIPGSSFATVPGTSSKAQATGDGSTTRFYFAFQTSPTDKSWIQVQLGTTPVVSGFTVALNANQLVSPGGSVTFATAPAAGTAVTISRALPLTQGLKLTPYTQFPAAAVEQGFDRVTMALQQVDRTASDAAALANGAIASATAAGAAAGAAAAAGAVSSALSALPVTASGSTTARGLAARFGETFNVRDFGALGDCIADDTYAQQRALDALKAAGGGTVYYPPGCYRVATVAQGWAALVLNFTTPNTSPVALVGSGATIVYSGDPSKVLLGIGGAPDGTPTWSQPAYKLRGLTIEGLEFVGTRIPSDTDIEATQGNTLLHLAWVEDATVQNSRFRDNNGAAIYFFARGLKIVDDWFLNSNGGVQGQASSSVTVANSHFICTVKCDDQVGIFGTSNGPVKDFSLTGNTFNKGYDGAYGKVGGTKRGWGHAAVIAGCVDGFKVNSNIFADHGSYMVAESGVLPGLLGFLGEACYPAPLTANGPKNGTVSSNVFRNAAYGVYSQSGALSSVAFTGNVFQGLEVPIQLNGTSDVPSNIGILIGPNLVSDSTGLNSVVVVNPAGLSITGTMFGPDTAGSIAVVSQGTYTPTGVSVYDNPGMTSAPIGGISSATWTVATLLNSWQPLGGLYLAPAYRRDALGNVCLRGIVKNGNWGQPVLTVPTGFKPPGSQYFTITSNNAYGNLIVDAAGNVSPNIGNPAWVSLDGVCWNVNDQPGSAASSTALSTSGTPIAYGSQVTFTATVAPSTATGLVTFFDNGASIGTGSLSSGTATLATTALSVGLHSVSAIYAGNGQVAGSSSAAISQTVTALPTTTGLQASVNTLPFGSPVTLTASVTPSSASGQVSFLDGASVFATVGLSAGSAVLTTSALTAGSHLLYAVYSGDAAYSASSSLALGVDVGSATPTVSLATSGTPSWAGALVTFTVTVAGSGGTPAGTITFLDGGVAQASNPLVGGSAIWATSTLAAGLPHSITAAYTPGSGSPYTASTSSAVSQVVTSPILVGSAATPSNQPISSYLAGIAQHFGTVDPVDHAATAAVRADLSPDLHFGFPVLLSAWDGGYGVYWSQPGDASYALRRIEGSNAPAMVLDPWTGQQVYVRLPVGAHGSSSATDQHVAVIDTTTNRIYSMYSEGTVAFGVNGSYFDAGWFGIDKAVPDDAAVAALSTATARYTAGYESAVRGQGMGIPLLATSGGVTDHSGGDTNGLDSPHAVIMPQDFSDAGWSGESVGTLHHALRWMGPIGLQWGNVWPMTGVVGYPAVPVAGAPLRNGQIVRLRTDLDVTTLTSIPWQRRVLKTLQVYGAVVMDNGSWNTELRTQGNWAGLGPTRGGDPWVTSPNPEAQAVGTLMAANGGTVNLSATPGGSSGTNLFAASDLEVLLPHGAYGGATITISSPDTTAPVVGGFTTGTVSGLSVPVVITATDAVGVTGYGVTTSSTPPAASALTSSTGSFTWTGSAAGSVTLWAWARDAVGNVSAVYGTTRTVVLTAAPGSARLGVNLEGLCFFTKNDAFNNLMTQAGTDGGPIWRASVPSGATLSTDSNGWPTAAAGATNLRRNLSIAAGTYRISFKAKVSGATASISNCAVTGRAEAASGDGAFPYLVSYTCPYTSGDMSFSYANATGGISGVKVLHPGSSDSDVLSPVFKAAVSQFAALRFYQAQGYEGEGINTGTEKFWADRRKPTFSTWCGDSTSSAAINGVPYEAMILAANDLGEDVWFNVPYATLGDTGVSGQGLGDGRGASTDDYVIRMAQVFKCGSDGTNPWSVNPGTSGGSDKSACLGGTPAYPPLGAGRHAYVEFGNELWNTSWPYSRDRGWMIAAANAEYAAGNTYGYMPSSYNANHPWTDRVARMVMKVSDLWRSVWGDAAMGSTVRIVAAGENGPGYTEDVLLAMAQGGRTVSHYVYAIATAPYFNNGASGGSASAVIAAMASDATATSGDNPGGALVYDNSLASSYGIRLASYEGGVGNLLATGTSGLAVQSDTRVRTQVLQPFFARWYSAPGAASAVSQADLFAYYTLAKAWDYNLGNSACTAASTPYSCCTGSGAGSCVNSTGPGAFFGLSQSIADQTGPKWDAILNIIGGNFSAP